MNNETNTMTKTLIQHQIKRLAKIYNSKTVNIDNISFHLRVGNLQSKLIKQSKKAK